MSYKSVIDIDVNDGQFKAFYELYDKYRDTLRATPGAWAASSKEAEGLAKAFTAAAGGAAATTAATRSALTYQERLTRNIKDSVRQTNSLVRGTAQVAHNIAGATRNLLKWVSIGAAFSGLAAAGGLFGLGSMAGSVSGSRRGAAGLGVSIGQQSAFNLNYGRFVDPSFLGNVTDAMQDQSKRWTLHTAGLTDQDMAGKNPEDVAEMLLPKIRQKFIQGGRTVQGLHAYGLDQFTDLQGANRLANASPEELAAQKKRVEEDRQQLNIQDAIARKWQDFSTQLGRAGLGIERVFVTGLAPLVGPFSKLSEAIARALESVLSNPDLPHYIDAMGKGIERFAAYIQSDEAKKDIGDFLDDIKAIGSALATAAGFIKGLFGEKAEDATPSTTNRVANKVNQLIADSGHDPFANDPGSRQEAFYQLEKAQRLPFGLLERVAWQESRGNPKAVNKVSGAKGEFQFMDDTAAEYGLHGADVFDEKKSSKAASLKLAHLIKYYSGDTDKAIAAYDWGEGHLDKAIARADKAGVDWRQILPKETKDYLNNVGGLQLRDNTTVDTTGAVKQAANQPAKSVNEPSLFHNTLAYLKGLAPGPNYNNSPARGAVVTIQNNTGGAAVVSVNQAAY